MIHHTPKTRALYIKRLVARSLDGADKLSFAQQVELYEGAGLILHRIDRQMSKTAFHTAALLREADRHQLDFLKLLLKP